MTFDLAWQLAVVGLLGGFGGGLLGIGGSVIMIPGMVLLLGGDRQHLYQAAAMIVNFFVVAPAAWRHRRAGAIVGAVVRWTVPTAAAGAVVGAWTSDLSVFRGPGQGWLQLVFAGVLFYALAYNLMRLRSGRRLPPIDAASADRYSPAVLVFLVGLPAGLLGGLLGIGGGLFAVPAQQIFLRMPLRHAIANSAATILVSSVVGAVVKNAGLARHGLRAIDAIELAAVLIPAAMIGSWIAAGKVHRWDVRVIRAAFSALLLYGGVRLAQTGWSQLSP